MSSEARCEEACGRMWPWVCDCYMLCERHCRTDQPVRLMRPCLLDCMTTCVTQTSILGNSLVLRQRGLLCRRGALQRASRMITDMGTPDPGRYDGRTRFGSSMRYWMEMACTVRAHLHGLQCPESNRGSTHRVMDPEGRFQSPGAGVEDMNSVRGAAAGCKAVWRSCGPADILN